MIKNERGIALITAVMLLLILTIIGLGAVNTMLIERDITAGETAYRKGFYMADSGISYARSAIKEKHIKNMVPPAQFGVPVNADYKLTVTRVWKDAKTQDYRFVVDSVSVPKSSLAATVCIQAEIKLATASRGAELDVGGEATY